MNEKLGFSLEKAFVAVLYYLAEHFGSVSVQNQSGDEITLLVENTKVFGDDVGTRMSYPVRIQIWRNQEEFVWVDFEENTLKIKRVSGGVITAMTDQDMIGLFYNEVDDLATVLFSDEYSNDLTDIISEMKDFPSQYVKKEESDEQN